ncbi:hypothetical protein HPC49_39915 [Pyxidicoccus fallax]|uniref:Lipoprotein n=1 Tax=Pyxidicoccus fallax TaxID=394095 RepID=A0A848LTS1_9BACT|nr:hypothetical protein [Pyxidicoccus fallax]NMO21071.1 hypothetical protein [Pyxidicoccus fallax]NPC84366.1 hypothetical protein [Pyxidicoccus fallax]
MNREGLKMLDGSRARFTRWLMTLLGVGLVACGTKAVTSRSSEPEEQSLPSDEVAARYRCESRDGGVVGPPLNPYPLNSDRISEVLVQRACAIPKGQVVFSSTCSKGKGMVKFIVTTDGGFFESPQCQDEPRSRATVTQDGGIYTITLRAHPDACALSVAADAEGAQATWCMEGDCAHVPCLKDGEGGIRGTLDVGTTKPGDEAPDGGAHR